MMPANKMPTANQSAPSWSAGYTGLLAAIQGSGGTGVTGFVGYRLDGSGTESPTVTWSGDPASNRDMLTLTFTAAASPATTTVRRRRMATYVRGTEGRLNDAMTTLGTTTPSLWPSSSSSVKAWRSLSALALSRSALMNFPGT